MGATNDELAFFDRVKKSLGNKQTMNEFLKLCNLFSQDLIDKPVLVQKVRSYLTEEQFVWFKNFVSYDEQEEIIENKPKPPTGRVALSNCRGLGPSYRLLPKRVRSIISLIAWLVLLSFRYDYFLVEIMKICFVTIPDGSPLYLIDDRVWLFCHLQNYTQSTIQAFDCR